MRQALILLTISCVPMAAQTLTLNGVPSLFSNGNVNKPTFNSGGTTTCNFLNTNVCEVDFGAGNTTLAFSATTEGPGLYLLRSCQDSVGSRTYTFSSNILSGSQPDPAAGTTNCTEQIFSYDGTNMTGVVTGVPGSSWHGVSEPEGSAPAGVANSDLFYADSAAHRWKMNNNNGGAVQVVASGVDINISDQITGTNGLILPLSAALLATNSSRQVVLGAPFASNAQTAAYQVLAADFTNYKTILVASGTFTITLVASGSQPVNGNYITILNYGTGVVILARSGQNINGAAANLTGTAGSATAPTGWRVWSDGTNYFAEVISGGGGGTSVSVNGGSVSSPNFNAATPAAPGGNVNVTWQTSGSSVSGYIPITPPGGAVVNLSAVTVNTNTTSDQTLMELALPTGYLNNLRQPFLFDGAGTYSTQTAQTPTITLKTKLCTVSGCGSGTVVTLVSIVSTATIAAVTNNNWNLAVLGYTATTGASGNLEIHGPLAVDLGALTTTADSVFVDTNTAVSSNIDLTAALFVDFTVAFSTNAVTANTFTQRSGGVMPFSGGSGSYAAAEASATTWSIPNSVHGLGTCDLSFTTLVTSGTTRQWLQPKDAHCEMAAGGTQYDVTINWDTATAGYVLLLKSGSGTGGANTALSNLVFPSLNTNLSVGNMAITMTHTNASSTGTTLNKLAKLTGAPSTAVTPLTTDTNGVIGICVSGCGTTSTAEISIAGMTQCIYDGATTAGDYVQISTTTAGDCHDAGATVPLIGQILGRVLTTNGGGGTYDTHLRIESQGYVELASFQDGTNKLQSPTSTQALTYIGGQDASANSALGSVTLRGANETGAGGASSQGGGALHAGGSNAATNTASAGGSAELLAGSSTGATSTGLQGLLLVAESYAQSGTVTQWNLECYTSTAKTATDCSASPKVIAGIALSKSSTIQVTVAAAPSEIPVNASAAVTIGHTVCAGTTAGKVTDSGGTTPCGTGITVGVVIATSGTWPTFPDGTAFPTLSTTLPLIRLASHQGVGNGDATGVSTLASLTSINGSTVPTAAGSNILSQTIASGTAAMGTGAISSGACATVVTSTATGVASTDVLVASFNGDPTAVTGYVPSTSGMLTIIAYPTSGNVNFKTCNNTGSSVTPGAITLNWMVMR